MVKFYRKSVPLSALWVSSNERLSDFYASSWQRGESPIPMLVIRILCAGMALAILSWSLAEAPTPYWLIYLTNWGLLLVASLFLCSLIMSSMAIYNRSYETKKLPWYASLYWAVFNVSVTISIMITALYWLLLYNAKVREVETRAFWLDVSTHGITSCLAVIELLLSRTPVRFMHLYQPLSLGLWYAVFSCIYYVAGGTDANGKHFIYEILDWSQSKRAGIIVVASMAGLIIVYAFIWAIALCRDKVSTLLVRTTSHDLPPAPPDRHTGIV
ncbi:hypothetical protein HW555_002590 [Spodoptera exigua]|uniref:Protein rolling stone-like n=1 Tax=Spodoptera exigua TaxID=7107 RepID=A0A835LE29_SPOEX|nr:hypothetical protein HW555_002590 [Spodoptera exigua]